MDKTYIDEKTREWHLDKKVPITLFIALLIQGAAFVWWAAELNGLVRQSVEINAEQNKRIEAMEQRERDNGKMIERVVRVETMIEEVKRTVNRIDDNLDSQMRRTRK